MGGQSGAIRHHGDLSILRNLAEQDVASYPARSTRCGTQRFALLDDTLCKKHPWHEEQIGYSPFRGIMQDQQVRGLIRPDSPNHCFVSRIDDFPWIPVLGTF